MNIFQNEITAHIKDIFSSLSDLRDTLCDVTLVAENVEFTAHRIILACTCEYFQHMFTSGMSECRSDEIQLDCLSSKGLSGLLEFIYTATIQLDVDNLEDVLMTANYLQMIPLLKICIKFAIEKISKTTCFFLYDLGIKLQVEELKVAAEKYILNNFLSIPESVICRIGPQKLARFLVSDKLQVSSEKYLIDRIVFWVDFNPISRMKYITRLLQYVRFCLLTVSELSSALACHAILRTNEECKEMIQSAFKYHSNPQLQPSLQSQITKLRSTRRVIAALVRMSNPSSPDKLIFLENEHWHLLSEVPFRFKFIGDNHIETAEQFVYLISHSILFRFDARFDTWLELPQLPRKRHDFATALYNNHIYLIGGRNESGTLLSGIDAFDLLTCEWHTDVYELESPVASPGCCLHENCLIVAGGHNDCAIVDEIFVLEFANAKWKQYGKLVNQRASPALQSISKDSVAVIGGGDEDFIEILNMMSLECSVVRLQRMSYISMNEPCAIATENGDILIMGGYDSHSNRYNQHSYIFKSETAELAETRIENQAMKSRILGLTAVVIKGDAEYTKWIKALNKNATMHLPDS